MNKYDSAIRDSIRTQVCRYYEEGRRDAGLLIAESQVIGDGRPSTLVQMLRDKSVHDDDYSVFRAFQNPTDVILDVGANWGYSAASIWGAGARCKIVSFEPVPLHSPCLQTLKLLFPRNYDYRLVGLSDCAGRLTLTSPVVNEVALSALASASPRPDPEQLTEHICTYVQTWMPAEEIQLKFCEFIVDVDELDQRLSEDNALVGVRNIAALKVDVEGFEFQALKGSVRTLEAHAPLVLVEGGNRVPHLHRFMDRLGYGYAERDGVVLIDQQGTTAALNGFYLHSDRKELYRELGIYR